MEGPFCPGRSRDDLLHTVRYAGIRTGFGKCLILDRPPVLQVLHGLLCVLEKGNADDVTQEHTLAALREMAHRQTSLFLPHLETSISKLLLCATRERQVPNPCSMHTIFHRASRSWCFFFALKVLQLTAGCLYV